jgi:SHS2 domain-containing protein
MENYYEYLDHTADIRVHAVGNSLEEAFKQAVLATMNIMTDINKISMNVEKQVECQAPDKEMLLVDYLTEYLALFDIENILFADVEIKKIEYDEQSGIFSIRSIAYGQLFDPEIHEMRSEVKAVTFSYLKIVEEPDKSELWVVLDL